MTRKTLHRLPFLTLILLFCLPDFLMAGGPQTAKKFDWPYWRGPEMNGISREKNIPAEWSPKGKNVLWKREDLGSRSTPVIVNGKLYLILRDQPETKNEGERVVCLDVNTGKTLWENRFNVFLSDVPDTRVGWSAVTADPKTGNIFALGVCGYFQCLDGETGKVLWSHSLSEEYGLLSTYGGRTNFPIVHENLVIISSIVIGWGDMAKPAHRFIAFDTRNGQPVWFNGTRLLPYDTTYSAPSLAVINGQSQLIFGSGDGGVHGFQPRTGKSIWKYDVSHRGINTSPLVVGNKVFCGHSEENYDSTQMGALFAIDATKTGEITKTGELWRTKQWFVGKSSPILVDNRLYAIEDKAQMLIVNPDNGELIARQKLGTMQRSSPLYADGKIFVCTANGRWYTFKPTEKGVEVLYKMRLNREESHGSPIVSHGRLFVPTTKALYCIGHKDVKVESDPRPSFPKESPISADVKPAHVQVVPVESLLKPGQKQQFVVNVYNAKGQYLGSPSAGKLKFSLEGAGAIDAAGKYSTPAENRHVAVTVKASFEGIEGSARVRVVPELPWKFDFEDGQVPITWVGARYRHIALDFQLLKKLESQNPLAAQAYIYLMSTFQNSGRAAIKFDRSSARQTLTAYLRFLNLLQDVTTVEQAKQKLDPALKLLRDEKFLAEWNWSTNDDGMVFTAKKGERTIDGNGVMTKIKTIPKGTRSQSWMGHPSFQDYTIQADVLGVSKDNKVPDIGLIGQRYTLDMMGASKKLQIRTWPPQLRMAKSIPFEWEPDVWYTMKMQTSFRNGKAVLKGKVWKRGDKEPTDWMVQAEDESPNAIGSPGLFGNAKDAEIFYDNITITAQ